MLDVKRVRANYEEIKEKLEKRGEDLGNFDQFAELDSKRRELIGKAEVLKAERNEASEKVAVMKRNKENADDVILRMRQVGDEIKVLDNELREVEEKFDDMMMRLPNIPHDSVPVGDSEDDNVEDRTWGEIREFDFEPKPHWDIATGLNIVDFERAAKTTGSRFVFYRGLGARLERALMNFMIDLHTEEHGYEEMLPSPKVMGEGRSGSLAPVVPHWKNYWSCEICCM